MLPTQDHTRDGTAGRVSRGQAAVLAQITAGLTRPTSTDEVYGQVVTAVAEQLGSVNTALCFHDAARGTLSLHTCYKHGTVTIYGARQATSQYPFRPFSSRSGASFGQTPVTHSVRPVLAPSVAASRFLPRHRGATGAVCPTPSWRGPDWVPEYPEHPARGVHAGPD